MARVRVKPGDLENRAAPDSGDLARPILGNESGALVHRMKEVIGDESVSSFSRRCGVSEAVLRSYLNDGRAPSIDKAVAIAQAGGVTVDWLATGRPPRTRADLAAQQGQSQGQARPASEGAFDGRRAMLEAVLRVAEHRIEQGAVDADTIAAGLAGAPAWLDAARGYPDLTVRLLSMAATLEFLKAAGAPASGAATRRDGLS